MCGIYIARWVCFVIFVLKLWSNFGAPALGCDLRRQHLMPAAHWRFGHHWVMISGYEAGYIFPTKAVELVRPQLRHSGGEKTKYACMGDQGIVALLERVN